ncbi:hypothetical protein ACWIUD_07755 [Helicobacter sp. 23-1044]
MKNAESTSLRHCEARSAEAIQRFCESQNLPTPLIPLRKGGGNYSVIASERSERGNPNQIVVLSERSERRIYF